MLGCTDGWNKYLREIVEGNSSEGTLNASPARLTLYCSENGLIVGQSLLEVTLREASSLGAYIPVVFGNMAIICLFDSGA